MPLVHRLRFALAAATAAATGGSLVAVALTSGLSPATAAAVIGFGAGALWFGDAVARPVSAALAEGARGALARIGSGAEAVFLVSHDGRIVELNDAAATLLEGEAATLLGASFARRFDPPGPAADALALARAQGSARGVELALRTGEGARRALEVSLSLVPGEGLTLPRVLVIARDVSDLRAAARAAETRAHYHRTLLEASLDPLLAVDADGRITDATESALARFGVSRDRLRGAAFAELFDEPAHALEALERTRRDGRVTDPKLLLRPRAGGRLELAYAGIRFEGAGEAAGGVLVALRDVTAARAAERDRDRKDWVVRGIARLSEIFQEPLASGDLSRRLVTELTTFVEAQVGALYALSPEGDGETLSLVATHGYTRRKGMATSFRPGEGLVGQAQLERKQVVLSDVPADYVRVASALGETTPRHLCITPLLVEGRAVGMLELASLGAFSDEALEYLKQGAANVAVALEASAAKDKVAAALRRAQALAAELEAQQETLRNTNAELEEQTAALRTSEQKLKSQQAEIELANTELTQKNDLLERQKLETDQARKVLAAQAEEVALASKYKSEFLANMSHELRTPLNSLLLLARSLRDNATGNLTAEQLESATVIFDSGSDLLNLINEILDLSKVEAGKMELRPEEIDLEEVERGLVAQFDHMARSQGLTLTVERAADAPRTISSDPQRLGQVLRNLVGNALKFTEEGGVTVRFAAPAPDVALRRSGLSSRQAFAVHVIDTGIGIPIEKQRIIFEAFQQADSGDRRRYGGTGLGLSISRELAALLGGEIQLESVPGAGSTFSLYLPVRVGGDAPARPTVPTSEGLAPARPRTAPPPPAARPEAPRPAGHVEDDRHQIGDHDHVILVIEDDVRFARIVAQHVRERGLRCLLAHSGEEGLALAREHRPDGVVLDIQLPKMDGWAVLHALKQDVALRHIPVHIVSVEEFSARNLRLGAIGHAAKPIAREQLDEMIRRLEAASAEAPKRVLVVEDDAVMRRETVRIVGSANAAVTEVDTGAAALAALAESRFDLAIMDLGLPDMQGLELLRRAGEARLALPPVIIHTNRELTSEEELTLRSYADSIIVKDVRSQERLIDEVALFLHRVVRDLPEENRRAILRLHESNDALRGKTVLIVEDDMRTMFAMARLLASHGVNPLKAEHGERALAVLAEQGSVDLVLMDMMMPVLDGYETMRRIRRDPRHGRLPIVALTAKAMKEDRQRCLEAGATDYMSKPVDPERLVSLMRVLLSR